MLKRFENPRLAGVLDIEVKVDRGEPPEDHDIAFLEQLLEDSHDHQSLVDPHQEWY